MKSKLLTLITIITMAITVTGCKKDSPTDVVDGFFKELKNGTNANMSEYIGSIDNGLDSWYNEGEFPKEAEAVINEIFLNIDADVINENIVDNTASVNISIESIDLMSILGELITENIGQAFLGKEFSEEEMMVMLTEKMKTAPLSSREGVINLTKENDEWKINFDDEFYMLIYGIDSSFLNFSYE